MTPAEPISLDTKSSEEKTRHTLVTFPIVDAAGNRVEADRRTGDRRTWSTRAQFPLRDTRGQTVTTNRRRRVDRRAYRTEVIDNPSGPRLPKILLDDGEALYELTCDDEVIKIGRGSDCELVASAHYVSRRHARIVRDGGRFVLQDMSSNGTYLQPEGGKERALRQNGAPLENRGIIRLGRTIKDGAEATIRYTIIKE